MPAAKPKTRKSSKASGKGTAKKTTRKKATKSAPAKRRPAAKKDDPPVPADSSTEDDLMAAIDSQLEDAEEDPKDEATADSAAEESKPDEEPEADEEPTEEEEEAAPSRKTHPDLGPIEYIDPRKITITDDVVRKPSDWSRADLADLTASIRNEGLLHPVVLDQGGNLRNGSRRVAAFIFEKIKLIPYRKAHRNTDLDALELNANETSYPFDPLSVAKRIDYHRTRGKMTERAIANKYGWSQTKVHRYLVLHHAPARFKTSVRKKEMSITFVTELLMKDKKVLKEAMAALDAGKTVTLASIRGKKGKSAKAPDTRKMPMEGVPELWSGRIGKRGVILQLAIPAKVGDNKALNAGLKYVAPDDRKVIRDAIKVIWAQL